METTYELEEMRQQLAILHNKLEQQTLINHDLMRLAMSDSYKGITRQRIISTIVTILVMPSLYIVFSKLSMSTAFIIYTELMLIAALIMGYMTFKELQTRDFLSEDIKTVSRKFHTHKKNETKRLFASVAMLVVFFVWYAFELSKSGNSEVNIAQIICVIIAIIVGGIASYKIQQNENRKMKKIEEQLLQLEE